jgi:hypothetical protein
MQRICQEQILPDEGYDLSSRAFALYLPEMPFAKVIIIISKVEQESP